MPGIGDPARTFARMIGGDLPFNPPFEMDNRGKRSIVIDWTTDQGRALALELIDAADVFVSNIRQAALKRFGFDPESLAERNGVCVAGVCTGPELPDPGFTARLCDQHNAIRQTVLEIAFVIYGANFTG